MMSLGCLAIVWSYIDVGLVLLDLWAGVKLPPPFPQKKLPSRNPALLGLTKKAEVEVT